MTPLNKQLCLIAVGISSSAGGILRLLKRHTSDVNHILMPLHAAHKQTSQHHYTSQ